jgi:hypothetical protein
MTLAWMITSDSTKTLEKYVGNGLTQPELNYFFGQSQDYQLERWPQNVAPAMPTAQTTEIFSDYNALVSALNSGAIGPNVKAIMYDPENWQFTPLAQQLDPALYEMMSAQVVHAHHLKLIAAPAADLTLVTDTGTGTIYQKYIQDEFAAAAAKYADVYEIQAQGLEANTSAYSQFVSEAVAQAKAANPNVTIFAGLSTSPDGQTVTSAELYRDVLATQGEIGGYWLNIAGPSAYSPNVTQSNPLVAVGLLNDIWLAAHG